MAFQSSATNLVAGDSNGRRDIFVHDTLTGITTRRSLNSAGDQGDDDSDRPTITANGAAVVFESDARNLATHTGDSSGIFLNQEVTHHLESPTAGSSESGIGLIRGWACDATSISVVIDDDPPLLTASGAERLDTERVCGDSDNGFGFVVNRNRYSSGMHRLRAYADEADTPFADVTFNVYNISVEYLTGVGNPSLSLSDFPHGGSSTQVTWSEPHQGMMITGYTP